MGQDVNIAAVQAELAAAFAGYERALVANDVAALTEYFWDSALTIRWTGNWRAPSSRPSARISARPAHCICGAIPGLQDGRCRPGCAWRKAGASWRPMCPCSITPGLVRCRRDRGRLGHIVFQGIPPRGRWCSGGADLGATWHTTCRKSGFRRHAATPTGGLAGRRRTSHPAVRHGRQSPRLG